MANYIFRKFDDSLWGKLRDRAKLEGHTIKYVLGRLIAEYIKHGFRK